MYQASGRPDLEGTIYGRHCAFELKSGTRFSKLQVLKLVQYHRSGSFVGGIVYKDGKVYYLNINQVNNYTERDLPKWTFIGDTETLDLSFMYKYLHFDFLRYNGASDDCFSRWSQQ
jgi:hypothetical protein